MTEQHHKWTGEEDELIWEMIAENGSKRQTFEQLAHSFGVEWTAVDAHVKRMRAKIRKQQVRPAEEEPLAQQKREADEERYIRAIYDEHGVALQEQSLVSLTTPPDGSADGVDRIGPRFGAGPGGRADQPERCLDSHARATRRAAGHFGEGIFSFASPNRPPPAGFAGFTLSFGSPSRRATVGFPGHIFSFGSPTRSTTGWLAEKQADPLPQQVERVEQQSHHLEQQQSHHIDQQQSEHLEQQQADRLDQDQSNLRLQGATKQPGEAADLQAIEQPASRAIEPVIEGRAVVEDIGSLGYVSEQQPYTKVSWART
jgi:hypothetical protein